MKRVLLALFLFASIGTSGPPPATSPRSPYWVPLVKRAAAAGGAGISQDGTFTQNKTVDGSFSHSQGSLANGYALIIVSYVFAGATAGASVTYDGGAATQIATFSHVDAYHAKIFYRDLGTASSGSKNVVVAHNDAASSVNTTVITWSGVKQGGGFTVVQTGGGGFADPQTFNISTTSSSEVVVGAALINATAANTAQTGTLINEEDTDGVTYNNQKYAGTGGTVAVTWDLNAASHGACVGVVLQPAP